MVRYEVGRCRLYPHVGRGGAKSTSPKIPQDAGPSDLSPPRADTANGAIAFNGLSEPGLALEYLLEPGEVFPIGATHRPRDEGRDECRESRGPPAIAEPHAGPAPSDADPLIDRLHRKWPLGRGHHQPLARHKCCHPIRVREPAPEKLSDESDLRTEAQGRRRFPLDALDVDVPARRVLGIGGVARDVLTWAFDDDLSEDVDHWAASGGRGGKPFTVHPGRQAPEQTFPLTFDKSGATLVERHGEAGGRQTLGPIRDDGRG